MPRNSRVMRTVRLPPDLDLQLVELANSQGVSVNTLTGRALQRFVEWDAYAEKFGFVDLPASLVTKLIETLTPDQARELGRWMGRDLLREYVMFCFKDVSSETVLHAFPHLLAKYGRVFAYEEHVEGTRRTLVIKHGRGPNLSIFYESVVAAAFTDLLKMNVRVERMESQIVARFAAI